MWNGWGHDTESVGKLKSCHFNEEFFCPPTPRDAFYVEHAEMGGAVVEEHISQMGIRALGERKESPGLEWTTKG